MKRQITKAASFVVISLFYVSQSSADVACVQAELKAAGYNPGPVDGALGKKTVNAASKMGTDYGFSLPTLDKANSQDWCASLRKANESARIDTKEKLLSEIAGKKLILEGNWVVVNANGTLEGIFGEKPVKGTWEMKDGYWCRTLQSPAQNSDCQIYRLTPNGLIVTRNKGKGKSATYQVAGS